MRNSENKKIIEPKIKDLTFQNIQKMNYRSHCSAKKQFSTYAFMSRYDVSQRAVQAINKLQTDIIKNDHYYVENQHLFNKRFAVSKIIGSTSATKSVQKFKSVMSWTKFFKNNT